MKTSIGFRVSFTICAAALFVGAFSIISVPTQAEPDSTRKAKKAAGLVAKAEELAKRCRELETEASAADTQVETDDSIAGISADDARKAEADAAEAMKNGGLKKTGADVTADEAAKEADAAAQAADDALDKGEKGTKQTEAKKKEAAADTADNDAAKEDEGIQDADVRKKKQDARVKRKEARADRRKARASRRSASEAHEAASKKCTEAEDARKAADAAIKLAEEAIKKKTDGGAKDDEGIGGKLKGLNDRLKEAFAQNTVMPPSADKSVQTKIANGLNTVTFDTLQGRVIVNLPDDMMAGDTISGTVIAEPKGQTPEERTKNQAELQGYVVAIFPTDDRARKTPPIVTFDASKGMAQSGGSSKVTETFVAPKTVNVGLFMMPNENSPIGASGRNAGLTCINESCSPISQLVFAVPTHPSGAMVTPDPRSVAANMDIPVQHDPIFWLPNLAQQGRPIVILGPFDGDFSNTTLRSSVQDFEKGTENVSGGFGLLAESRGKAVFDNSTRFTGPTQLTLKEGNKETKGTCRNVGVNLTAPKTNLLKGEKTELRVEVRGLEGIKEPVPLTLESRGVITVEGGTNQQLVIQPSQVGADGRYSTTRGITGVQTGGWTATATVVTHPVPRGNLTKPLTQNEKDALIEEAHNMTAEQLNARLKDLGQKLEAEGRDQGIETDQYKRLKEELDIFNAERRKRK